MNNHVNVNNVDSYGDKEKKKKKRKKERKRGLHMLNITKLDLYFQF